MATKAVAQWAVQLQYSALPPSMPHTAVRCFYNWVGCVIGGSTHPTTSKARRALSPFFGKETSTLLGHGGKVKTDAQHAALINGIASHVNDYDDTHLATIIHPTGPVASALLAYAETHKGISGRDFILALVAGIEVQCKLGMAVWPQHYDIGWHITSTVGAIGAAVAVGKLMKLSVPEMQHAIGVAATQVTGLREMFGSDTKSFHPGRAAQNGLMAAVLAQQGYTSSLTALEAKRGWASCVSTRNDLDGLFATLGKTWETEANAFKPFPCGIVCHPAIDACIQLHHDLVAAGIKPETLPKTLKTIQLQVHHLVIELTSKRTPRDGLEAKFSVFHGCAVGLLYGKAGPAQYADDVVVNPDVVAIRDKVQAEISESIEADQCKVQVSLEGSSGMLSHPRDRHTVLIKVVGSSENSQFFKYIEHALGSLEVEMTDKQLEEKFVDQCEPVIGQSAQCISDSCWALEDIEDVGSLVSRM